MSRRAFLLIALLALAAFLCPNAPASDRPLWDPFLDTLQTRTLRWFLDTADPLTGLVFDRYPTPSPSSVAAVGFGLTAIPIAAERGILTRAVATDRVLATLRFLRSIPQGPGATGIGAHRGLFYHFIDMHTGIRAWKSELSTIDTGLLMGGILFCQSYFDQDRVGEDSIRAIADHLYRRVEWDWSADGREGLTMGWTPEDGFHDMTWQGYNEAMILYLLALGSPTHPVPPTTWDHWTATYRWEKQCGEEFVTFGPLFGHHYSHLWIDFRGIRDNPMRAHGIDYFENSRRATLSQRAYAAENPQRFRDYGADVWGFTACDGPPDTVFSVDGTERRFSGYGARSVCYRWINDDGTLAPTAPGGSLPFAPEVCIPALKTMRARYGDRLFQKYGFLDSFNPTFVTPGSPSGWFDRDYLGIDQGPIALMIENHRNGFVWNVMKKNPYVVAGLRKAGFSGGWLEGR
jgi:hypothetical protein